jgi:hypothetical protein
MKLKIVLASLIILSTLAFAACEEEIDRLNVAIWGNYNYDAIASVYESAAYCFEENGNVVNAQHHYERAAEYYMLYVSTRNKTDYIVASSLESAGDNYAKAELVNLARSSYQEAMSTYSTLPGHEAKALEVEGKIAALWEQGAGIEEAEQEIAPLSDLYIVAFVLISIAVLAVLGAFIVYRV